MIKILVFSLMAPYSSFQSKSHSSSSVASMGDFSNLSINSAFVCFVNIGIRAFLALAEYQWSFRRPSGLEAGSNHRLDRR